MVALLRPTEALNALAIQINASHENVISSVRKSLLHAKECGEQLLDAKAQLGHGNWLDWLEENIEFSDRTAQKLYAGRPVMGQTQGKNAGDCGFDFGPSPATAD